MLKRKKEHREVFGLIKNSDIVLEVADGRLPLISRITSIESYVEKLNIPLIIVLNKCDLVPREICEKTKKNFNNEYPTVYISTKDRQGTKILRQKIMQHCPKKEIIVSLIGIPNTGKSSLLNILRGKHVASTGQTPGITRHNQVVRISKRILMFDTPGIIPFDHPNVYLQAFLGAIPIGKLDDPLAAAFFFLNRIRNHYSGGLIQKYEIPSIEIDNEAIINHIAQKRGLVIKGGHLNVEEASKVFMREFTAGVFPYWEEIPQKCK